MNLKKIKVEDFEYFYSLLEQDFCYDERKTKKEELKAFNNSKFIPCFIYYDNNIVGYFCYWDLGNFYYGEHLAILKEYRDAGLGSKFLKKFLTNLDKPLVFEIERPVDVQSKRRIKFYEQFNLVFNEFDYYQPLYHKRGKEIPMIFISYPKALTEKEYVEIIEIIKKEVYNT